MVKSANVYLDFKDPYKVLLTSEEISSLLAEFSKKKEEVLPKLQANDCSSYDLIDAKVKAGEERWKKYVKTAMEDEKILEAPEILRDNADLKPFNSLTELEAYSKYFVSKYIKVEQASNKNKALSEIKKSLVKLYLEEKAKPQDPKEVQANLITRSLFLAMDPHSDYISEEQASNFEMSMSANLQGVGLALKEDELGAKIIKVVKNGPAEKSGKFKKNDIITKVNGKSISNMSVNDVVELIRGDKGSKVKLSVTRIDSKTKKITTFETSLIRDIIPLEEQRVKAFDTVVDGKRIVVINLPSFYNDPSSGKGSSHDMIDAYKELKAKGKIDGLILDMRNNGGGLLDESIRVVGLFMKQPVAVQVKSPEGTRLFQAGVPPVLMEEPLVVLINRYSASASEIVAGALKDYNRALIVGDDRTYGKGTVQSVINKFRQFKLGMIKVTTGQFFTPGGSSTQLKGVTSHIQIPSPSQLQNLGEVNMKYALDWKQVASALPEKNSKNLESIIKDLSKNSQKRIQQNELFKKFSSMEELRKWQDDPATLAEIEEDMEESRFNLKKTLY